MKNQGGPHQNRPTQPPTRDPQPVDNSRPAGVRSKHYDHRQTAARFEPEAARIRADAAEQLEQILNPTRTRKAPDMPPITDTTSRLAAYRIKRLRTQLSLTLAQLAEQLDTVTDWSPSISQLSAIERCARTISLPELAALATVLETTVDQLIRPGELCEACGQEVPK